MTHHPLRARSAVRPLLLGCVALGLGACGGDPITKIGDGPGHEQRHTGGTGSHGECGSNTLCLTGGSGGLVSAGGSVAGGGSVGVGGSGTGGLIIDPSGTLAPNDGWVDVTSNAYGIQGALFSYADDTTTMTLNSDFSGSNACIAGTAALVDLSCVPTPPVTDCYGERWGAAIGFNLNQPLDPATGQADALAYDASAFVGFGFTITGAAIPTGMRFQVETTDGQYCTPQATPILAGPNTISFSQLFSECWTTGGASPDVTQIVRIAWQVVTNSTAEVPFDFCVSGIFPIAQ